MAEEPSRVVWSPSALRKRQKLPPRIQDGFRQRIELIKNHAEMYQVEDRGRWAGLRRINVGGWVLFYAYWHVEDVIFIEAIVPGAIGQR
jgi:mRNA-degrading endonuclease RelE of RelBE toxin-antitoxin system